MKKIGNPELYIRVMLALLYIVIAVSVVGFFVFDSVFPGAIAVCALLDIVLVSALHTQGVIAARVNRGEEDSLLLKKVREDNFVYGAVVLFGNVGAIIWCYFEIMERF